MDFIPFVLERDGCGKMIDVNKLFYFDKKRFLEKLARNILSKYFFY